MCNQVGMQVNEHIKDLSNNLLPEWSGEIFGNTACPCIMSDTLTSHFNH